MHSVAAVVLVVVAVVASRLNFEFAKFICVCLAHFSCANAFSGSVLEAFRASSGQMCQIWSVCVFGPNRLFSIFFSLYFSPICLTAA